MSDIEKGQVIEEDKMDEKSSVNEKHIGLTRVMNEYFSLKALARRYLLMTFAVSFAAILVGVGFLYMSDLPGLSNKTKMGKPRNPIIGKNEIFFK